MSKSKTAIIIGAGPAGLTAALEFLTKTDIKPIVIEASGENGGISKTINHNGNRIDIGGHRFFSKSDKVMDWWQNILPIEPSSATQSEIRISYQNKHRTVIQKQNPNPSRGVDDVMLIRRRVSRIFFGGRFYNYPISLSFKTLTNLGPLRVVRIGFSYFRASLFPRKTDTTLEDFLINRFGRELYITFFRDYTEKVWGVPCSEITSEWGAQRIKGLSITKAVIHAFKQILTPAKSFSQKNTETSLIEYFLYPKFGPGHMWDCVAKDIIALGGEIIYHHKVDRIEIDNNLEIDNNRVGSVRFFHTSTNEKRFINCDFCISTMPIRSLVTAIKPSAPGNISIIASGLVYRDFITVGLLVNRLKIKPEEKSNNGLIPDNWIYIQDPNVKLGRLQIFNNWSPGMVNDPNKVWLGLEYFCNEGDSFWSKSNEDIIEIAIRELALIDIIQAKDVLDSILIKMPKAYPAYFGTYPELPTVRRYLDNIENLFLVGRNGMHKYNNQDHSMLTAMQAVENIRLGVCSKENIWKINTEDEYHEST